MVEAVTMNIFFSFLSYYFLLFMISLYLFPIKSLNLSSKQHCGSDISPPSAISLAFFVSPAPPQYHGGIRGSEAIRNKYLISILLLPYFFPLFFLIGNLLRHLFYRL